MTQALLLPAPTGTAPRTDDGDWGVVMLQRSGHDKDKQWFEFKPGFYQAAMRTEWPLGTMLVAVPPAVAEPMVQRGHARIMTMDEAEEFNAQIVGPKPVTAAKRKKPEPEPELEHSTVSEKDIPQEPHPPLPEEVEDQGPDVLGERPDATEAEPERKPVSRRKRLAEGST